MITEISKFITAPPEIIQIAKDGKWESCLIIDLRIHIPKEKDIDNFLSGPKYNSLAAELIFPGNFIWGMIFRKGLKVSSGKGFIIELIQFALSFSNFTTFCNDVETNLLGFTGLFKEEPDLIRIGIVNHWFSVGPLLVWEKGNDKELLVSDLNLKLKGKAEVAKSNLNYQRLSFIFATQDIKMPYHWMKSPCAKQDSKSWVVDIDQVGFFLKEWLDFVVK